MDDPTPAQITTLSDRMQPYAIEIISNLRNIGIPAIIVAQGARRNPTTQQALLAKGVSATLKSAHLTGDAFDIDIWGLARGDIPEVFWSFYGQMVESYGLVWGGRWTHPYDPGHCELPKAMRVA